MTTSPRASAAFGRAPRQGARLDALSRRQVMIGLGVGLAGLVGACARDSGSAEDAEAAEFAGILLGEPLAKPTQLFTDTSGAPFSFAEATEGQLSLLFFGYTSCPDICPVHLGIISRALERIDGPAGKALLAFVGVDTARDTPEVMRTYLDRFDEDFVGLTASDAVIEEAQVALNLPPVVIEPPDADGGYNVGHASQVLVFTPDNLCHLVYPVGTRQQDWMADLPRLLTKEW